MLEARLSPSGLAGLAKSPWGGGGLFTRPPQPRVRSTHVVCQGIAASGSDGDRLRLRRSAGKPPFQEPRRSDESLESRAQRIYKFAKAKNFAEVIATYEAFSDPIGDTGLANLVCNAARATGNWEVASRVIDDLSANDAMPDVFTYNAAIAACAGSSASSSTSPSPQRPGSWRRAVQLLDIMRQRGVRPDVVSYNTCMHVCGRAKQWQRVLHLLGDMKVHGPTPNVYTWNTALSALARGGQHAAALGLLDEMRGAGQRPDAVTYRAAAAACEQGGLWEAALELLEQHRAELGSEPDVQMYTSVVNACRRARQAGPALQLLDEMAAKGVEATDRIYNRWGIPASGTYLVGLAPISFCFSLLLLHVCSYLNSRSFATAICPSGRDCSRCSVISGLLANPLVFLSFLFSCRCTLALPLTA
ncbi:unnamed protein product [Phaeothamnion confervicola]